MKTEQARIPITDFIKVWCELCRIRIDAREERTDVGGKTYHSYCYSTLFAAAPKPTGQSIRAGFQSLREIRERGFNACENHDVGFDRGGASGVVRASGYGWHNTGGNGALCLRSSGQLSGVSLRPIRPRDRFPADNRGLQSRLTHCRDRQGLCLA